MPNRIEGFTRDSLTRALYEEKTLIKAWLMRGTVHIVATADFPVYQKALRASLIEGWEQSLKKQTLIDIPHGWARLLDAIVKSLGEGPLDKRDILARVGGLVRAYSEREQKRLVGWALRALTYRGMVCHDRPTGPWYHFKDNRFALVSDWLNCDRLDKIDGAEARVDILVKYLRGYGPATVRDFAYWAGIRMPLARQTFDTARERLLEVRVKGGRESHWMLSEHLKPLRGEAEPRVSFLPEFDSLIMGHRDKSRIMDERHRKRVFLRLATVTPTLLVNGRVAGTWDYSFASKRLATKPFQRLPKADRDTIEDRAAHLAKFLGQ
jgi:hypothetical protein